MSYRAFFLRAKPRLMAASIALMLLLSVPLACHVDAADGRFSLSATRLYDLEALRLIVHIANALYPADSKFEPREAQVEAKALSSRMARLTKVGGRMSIVDRAWFARASIAEARGLVLARSAFELQTSVVNFGDPDVQRDIREWLGSTAPVIPISRVTAYIVASRAHFSDPWLTGFDEKRTVRRNFFGLGGITHPAFMTNPSAFIQYERFADGAHVRLPLRGGISLWIYEPADVASLMKPMSSLFRSIYRPTFAKIPSRACFLTLPRFSAQDAGGIDLIPLVQALRKASALDGPAVRMSQPPTAIVQSSAINVNESGVSTSSVTVIYQERMLIKRAVAIIDHPFAFAIVDELDSRVMFLGSIVSL
jgi:hypothetical protein